LAFLLILTPFLLYELFYGFYVFTVELNIGSTYFHNSFPTDLGKKLPNLQILVAYNSGLAGDLSFLLGMTGLENLDVSVNDLHGTIPTFLGQFKSLDSLLALYNVLTGTIPTELANLPNTAKVYFDHNQLDGSVPASVCNDVKVISVDCANPNAKVTCPCPTSCCCFSSNCPT
jgi:hypothetical protein